MQSLKQFILEATQATGAERLEVIQSLWSGYGEIVRYGLSGSPHERIVVKHVRLPKRTKHPRGWNTDISHERKIKSYEVETAWYSHWSEQCTEACRVPRCLAHGRLGDEVIMVLEDLDAAGFNERRGSLNEEELKACLDWLANFHACFLGVSADELWASGTYWHLETRPDELDVLDDQALKDAAPAIDARLKQSPFQTLVHGDAKLANFCFSPDGRSVAAVDFQYVGGGCGMKDLAYFVGSCFRDEACEEMEEVILDLYFTAFHAACTRMEKSVDGEALERDWRALYPVAWTDFHRFMKGWSPGHWKISSYSERLAREVIASIEAEA